MILTITYEIGHSPITNEKFDAQERLSFLSRFELRVREVKGGREIEKIKYMVLDIQPLPLLGGRY